MRQIDGQTDEQIDGQIDGHIYGQIYGQGKTSIVSHVKEEDIIDVHFQ